MKFCISVMLSIWVISFISCKNTEQTARNNSLSERAVFHNDGVMDITFKADGTSLLLLQDDLVKMMTYPEGSVAYQGSYNGVPLEGIAFGPANRTLVGGVGHTLYFWNLTDDSGKAGRQNFTRLTGKSAGGSPSDIAFSPAGKYTATSASASPGAPRLVIWNTVEKSIVTSLAHVPKQPESNFRYSGNAVAFNLDGDRVAVALQPEALIKVWSVPEGKLIKKWKLDQGTAETGDLIFSPDGNFIATTGTGYSKKRGWFNQPIQLWSVENGEKYRSFRSSKKSTSLVFFPSGELLAGGMEDGSMYIWNTKTGALIRKVDAHSQPITTLAISPEGKPLISGSMGTKSAGAVKVWDLSR